MTALANATMLEHPRASAQTALTADASDVALGAVLEQREGSRWVPLAFFSRRLQAPEVKYGAFDRELLALYLAICHFCYFLEGRAFTAFTDHKPLTFTLTKVSDPWSARQQRHLACISEFTSEIPTSRHGLSLVHVPTMLRDCAHVLLRRDAQRSPFQRVYEGPYKVLSTGVSTFMLDLGGKEEFVSVSHLKPAHVDEDSPVTVATPRCRGRPPVVLPPSAPVNPGYVSPAPPPFVTPVPRSCFSCPSGPVLQVPIVTFAPRPRTTRSGRTVRLPVRFRYRGFWGGPCSGAC
ncbi:uncharacterized protein LOC129694894 [Leucoraja erinacea]|uniref:uncharacterized protein LOC129694894 n=1 Tax=Leucoraja erinaceus TaxID=7782 RepID=UPI002456BABF|nr:uncharacterized protein LOC129694894 [Leucoraja erinacea]XP_055487623.1 uncharacterized protein LOC129694894 [Leucoraja erinacea]XP_055487624.1 uncharacterized protein LOC129694894 [Leucoraja erinacea]